MIQAIEEKYLGKTDDVIFGWVITSADEFEEDVNGLLGKEKFTDYNLRLINGFEVAALILEHGIELDAFSK